MRRRIVLALVVVLALSPVASAAVNTAVNYDATPTPDERISFQLTKDSHNVSWSGPAVYVDDNGELTDLSAAVNQTYDNPHGFVPSDVRFEDAGAFPHDKSDVSALESGEWSKAMGSSTGSATISDTETAPNVDAVSLSTSSQSNSDTAKFTFSNFSVDSDPNKRYLQLVLDVDTLETDAVVEVEAVDSDGDYYAAEINGSRSSGEDYIAGGTGEGIVYQRQLGDMTLVTDGDGSFDDISKIRVQVHDADAAVSISGLNVESMSPWTFGERRVDSDGDDELETETITENKSGGRIWIHEIDSMGSTFDQATIHDLSTYWYMTPSMLDSEDVKVEYGDNPPNQAYDGTATVYYRMGIPAAYELSPSNARRVSNQTLSSTEVVSVEYAEQTGDTNFTNVPDSTWTTLSSNFDARGKNVTIDDTLQSGQQSITKFELQLTQPQIRAMQDTSGMSGGGGGHGGSRGGGILSMIISTVGAAITSLLAILGIQKRKGS